MGKNILQTTNKRVRPLWLCPLIKKIFTLFIWLLLLPVTALAAAPNGQELYVGGMQISSTGYWTTDSDGNVTSAGETQPGDNYIHYNANDNILTLHNATIKKELAYDQNTPAGLTIHGSAIGVLNQSGDAELTVQLEGSNMIDEVSTGIYVYSLGGGAALNIKGNGTLVLNSNYPTIQVISSNGNAALGIKNAKVTAKSSYSNGVTVQSGNSETSSASLTVDGGSLTATADSNNVSGIRLRFGTSGTGNGTPTVTVSNNAIVRATGTAGGITSNSSTGVQYGTGGKETGGIIWNGTEGTVYGDVTLQEDITIGEGESLTIGQDASLNTGSHEVIVNGGTLNGADKITGTVKYAPTITTQPTSQTVTEGETATFTVVTSGTEPLSYQWQQSTDSGQSWTDIDGATDATYTTEATTTSMNGYQYRCVVSNSAGSGESNAAILTVNAKPTYTITAESSPAEGGTVTVNGGTSSVSVEANSTVNLVATPNAGYRFTGWTSSNEDVTFADASSASTTFTMPAGDVIVTAGFEQYYPVTSITLDKSELSLYTAESETLTATIEPDNATNQTVIWSSDKPEVAMVDDDGKVTAMAAGKATITAMADGGKTATCVVQVRKPATVEPSGSTNLSFTTDRDEFSLTATVHAQGNDLNPKDDSWTWTVEDENVVALVTLRSKAVFYSTSSQAFTIKGTGTTTLTATYDDGTYRGLVEFKVSISKPTPPDPISYYNIYVEDVCDGVEVTTSKNVVREGGSVSVYVEKDTVNYTFDNFKVYYKRSYYGTWNELPEGVQPGEYPIKNIWNHIYIKAEGAKEKEDPTGIESIEGVKVYTKDGSLYVQTPQREQVIIVSMSGAVVKNEEQVGLKQYHGLQPGIYIVRVGDKAYKLRLN